MIMNTLTDIVQPVQSEVLIGVLPDLKSFNFVARNWYNTYIASLPSDKAWNQVPDSDTFVAYLKVCLRLYIHWSHGQRFNERFRTESPTKLLMASGDVYLPTFALQMVRETARMMFAGDAIIFPFLPLDSKEGDGLVPGLGFNTTYRLCSTAFKNLGCPAMVQENCGCAPIFVANDVSIVWSNGQTMTQSRMYSVNALRHLNRTCELLHGCSTYERKAANPAVVQLDTVSSFEFEVSERVELKGLAEATHEYSWNGTRKEIQAMEAKDYPSILPDTYFIDLRRRLHVNDDVLNSTKFARVNFNFSSKVFRVDAITVAVSTELKFPTSSYPSVATTKAIGKARKGKKKGKPTSKDETEPD